MKIVQSSHSAKPTNPKYTSFISKNLRYITSSIGIDINGMANIVGLNVAELRELESDRHIFKPHEDCGALIPICNYASITLDMFVLTDLESKNVLKGSWFAALKKEIATGCRADRRPFNLLFARSRTINKHNRLDAVLGKCLWGIHDAQRVADKYHKLRSKGLISKIDFFE